MAPELEKHPRYANRRANLQLLLQAIAIRQRHSKRGAQARLAEILGTNQPHLSSILNGKRELGDDLAARAAQAFRRPRDWMDDAHSASIAAELAPHVPVLPPRAHRSTAPRSTVGEPAEAARVAMLEQRLEALEALVRSIARKP